MNIENRLLSRIIDNNDIAVVARYNLTAGDFTTQADTFKFIQDYYKQYGEAPAYTTVVAECESFEYVPEVLDSPDYMCKKIKADNAKRKSFDLLQREATEKFSKLNGADFITWLHEETQPKTQYFNSHVH